MISIWKISMVAVLMLAASAFAGAQCVGCTNDAVTCHQTPQMMSNYPRCHAPCGCTGYRKSVAYLDAPSPGILVAQSDGRLLVETVMRGSPAALGGILPGDEIVMVNGHYPFGAACQAPQWNGASQELTELTIKRGGRSFSAQVHLVPLRTFLDARWTTPLSAIRLASFSESPVSSSSYTLGIQWENRGSSIVVTNVLQGSPADEANFLVGDIIADLSGATTASSIEQRLQSAKPGSEETVTLERGEQRKRTSLSPKPLSRILRQTAADRPLPSVIAETD